MEQESKSHKLQLFVFQIASKGYRAKFENSIKEALGIELLQQGSGNSYWTEEVKYFYSGSIRLQFLLDAYKKISKPPEEGFQSLEGCEASIAIVAYELEFPPIYFISLASEQLPENFLYLTSDSCAQRKTLVNFLQFLLDEVAANFDPSCKVGWRPKANSIIELSLTCEKKILTGLVGKLRDLEKTRTPEPLEVVIPGYIPPFRMEKIMKMAKSFREDKLVQNIGIDKWGMFSAPVVLDNFLILLGNHGRSDFPSFPSFQDISIITVSDVSITYEEPEGFKGFKYVMCFPGGSMRCETSIPFHKILFPSMPFLGPLGPGISRIAGQLAYSLALMRWFYQFQIDATDLDSKISKLTKKIELKRGSDLETSLELTDNVYSVDSELQLLSWSLNSAGRKLEPFFQSIQKGERTTSEIPIPITDSFFYISSQGLEHCEVLEKGIVKLINEKAYETFRNSQEKLIELKNEVVSITSHLSNVTTMKLNVSTAKFTKHITILTWVIAAIAIISLIIGLFKWA